MEDKLHILTQDWFSTAYQFPNKNSWDCLPTSLEGFHFGLLNHPLVQQMSRVSAYSMPASNHMYCCLGYSNWWLAGLSLLRTSLLQERHWKTRSGRERKDFTIKLIIGDMSAEARWDADALTESLIFSVSWLENPLDSIFCMSLSFKIFVSD